MSKEDTLVYAIANISRYFQKNDGPGDLREDWDTVEAFLYREDIYALVKKASEEKKS